MRSSLALGIRGAAGSKLLLSAATALVLAGCSSGADRLTASRTSQDEIYTASVPEEIRNIDSGGKGYARPLDQSSVTRKPLANARNYQSQQQTYTQPVYRQPIYQQPSYTQPPVIAAPQPQVAAAPSASMIAEGGQIRVEPGMTLFSIARANNVSVKDLARANNLQAPYAVRTGQILRVPGVAQARAPQLSAPATEAPAREVASKPAGSHEVEPGDTLYSLGRKYGVSPRLIASLNGLSTDSTLSVGQKLRIPAGGSGSTVVADNADVQEPAGSNGATLKKTSEGVPPLPAAPVQTASQQKDDDRIQPSDEAAGPAAAIDPSLPGFRWPVKGKIISGFGSKPNGLRNEGINIAVPEGTSVRAAESGVVAYAGNELKGYGNLVLIRHEGGWVTAYAHNKELFVKRGDTVKRGDVVAKAGQTGSVSSPQVHFEIRKGATAMDPMRFLSNSTAAN